MQKMLVPLVILVVGIAIGFGGTIFLEQDDSSELSEARKHIVEFENEIAMRNFGLNFTQRGMLTEALVEEIFFLSLHLGVKNAALDIGSRPVSIDFNHDPPGLVKVVIDPCRKPIKCGGPQESFGITFVR